MNELFKSIKLIQNVKYDLISHYNFIENPNKSIINNLLTEENEPLLKDVLNKRKSNYDYNKLQKALIKTREYLEMGPFNNCVEVNYKKTQKFGRYYPNPSITLTTMLREIRQTLSKSLYIDFDIVNAHPSIIYNIMKVNGIEFNNFKRYVENRSEIIEELKNYYNIEKSTIKNLMLSLLFDSNKEALKYKIYFFSKDNIIKKNKNIIHPYLVDLFNEILNIQDVIYEQNKDIIKTKSNNIMDENGFIINVKEKKNIKGSILSIWCQEKESLLLNVIFEGLINLDCIQKIKIKDKIYADCVLIYDGLMIKRKNATGLKNNMIEKYIIDYIFKTLNISFKVEYKPFEEDIFQNPLYKRVVKEINIKPFEELKKEIIKKNTEELKSIYKSRYIELFGEDIKEQTNGIIEGMMECVRFNSIKLYVYKSSIEDKELTELIDLDQLKLLYNEKNINNKEIFKSFEMIVDFITKEKITVDFVKNQLNYIVKYLMDPETGKTMGVKYDRALIGRPSYGQNIDWFNDNHIKINEKSGFHSLMKLTRALKQTLTKKNYIDLDLDNAYFFLVQSIFDNNKINLKYLKDYNDNKKLYRKETSIYFFDDESEIFVSIAKYILIMILRSKYFSFSYFIKPDITEIRQLIIKKYNRPELYEQFKSRLEILKNKTTHLSPFEIKLKGLDKDTLFFRKTIIKQNPNYKELLKNIKSMGVNTMTFADAWCMEKEFMIIQKAIQFLEDNYYIYPNDWIYSYDGVMIRILKNKDYEMSTLISIPELIKKIQDYIEIVFKVKIKFEEKPMEEAFKLEGAGFYKKNYHKIKHYNILKYEFY